MKDKRNDFVTQLDKVLNTKATLQYFVFYRLLEMYLSSSYHDENGYTKYNGNVVHHERILKQKKDGNMKARYLVVYCIKDDVPNTFVVSEKNFKKFYKRMMKYISGMLKPFESNRF